MSCSMMDNFSYKQDSNSNGLDWLVLREWNKVCRPGNLNLISLRAVVAQTKSFSSSPGRFCFGRLQQHIFATSIKRTIWIFVKAFQP